MPTPLPFETIVLASRNAGKIHEVSSILGPLGITVIPMDALAAFDGQDVEETGGTFLENAWIKARWAAGLCGRAVLADDSGLEVDALGGAPGVRSARYSEPGATTPRNNAKLVAALVDVPLERRTARFRCVAVLVLPDSLLGEGLPQSHEFRLTEGLRENPLMPVGNGAAATSVEILKTTDWREASSGPGGSSGIPPTVAAALEGHLSQSLETALEGRLVRVEGGLGAWFTGTLEGLIVDTASGHGGFGYDPHFYVPGCWRTVADLPADEKNRLSHRGQAMRKVGVFLGSIGSGGTTDASSA